MRILCKKVDIKSVISEIDLVFCTCITQMHVQRDECICRSVLSVCREENAYNYLSENKLLPIVNIRVKSWNELAGHVREMLTLS